MDRDKQPTPPSAPRAPRPEAPAKRRTAAAKRPAGGAKPAGGTPAGTSAPDIMSRLPKSRPQRASQRRRTPVAEGAKPATPRTPAASRKPTKRPAAAPARRPAAAKAATAKRPAAPPAGKGPSLPRLAVDGATEAVKLPLKVSGRLTLRALDAVARGLRRG